MSIRVGIVTRAMPYYGIQRMSVQLSEALQRQGFDVEVVTTREPGPLAAQLAAAQLAWRPIPGADWSIPALHALRVGRELARQRYDALILHHDKYAQAVIGMLPETMAVIPVIHRVAEDAYAVARVNRMGWNAAVAVSRGVQAGAGAHLGVEHPVVTIHHGITLPPLPARRPWEHPFHLLYAGRLDRAKGVLLLPGILRACGARGLDCRLTIVGAGPDARALYGACHAERVAERVDFLGWLDHAATLARMAASHALLLPSFAEGCSLALLEAQACGCPPVATRLCGSNDEVVEDGKTGLLAPPGDAAGFAEAVAALYDDRARWESMSRAARKRVSSSFSAEAMGAAYARLIRATLAGRYPLRAPRRTLPRLDQTAFTSRDYLPTPLYTLEGHVRRLFSGAWPGAPPFLGA